MIAKMYALAHIHEMKKPELLVKKNLEWLIEQRGTNPHELQRATGVKQPTIHRILSGESSDPRTATLQPLADYFGVRVADLRDQDLAMQHFTEARAAVQSDHGLVGNRRASLPLISWVQAGSWTGAVSDMRREDAEDWIPCPFNHGPNAFILRVVGFSMYNPGGEKSYAPGDFIAVDPEGEIRNKKMVVVRIDQEELATFKQLLIDEDGKMMLQALNPAHNPRMMELPDDSRIVGTVIGKWVPE